MDKKYTISSESELEAVIGEPMEFVKAKIASKLDVDRKSTRLNSSHSS